MNQEINWHKLCFALSNNKATMIAGGIFYKGQAYRQTTDHKALEAWDSRKCRWIKTKVTVNL
jgi:hypothetical protein